MGFLINSYRYGGIVIPTGIIMPFNDVASNIPTGWTQWTDAGTRALMGHASTAGSTGGNTYVTRTSSSTSHTGTGSSWWAGSSSGSSADKAGGASGSHAHSLRINYSPARRFQVMMKATQDAKTFPVNTGILGDTDLTGLGLSDITSDGYMLCGQSGTSSSNSNAASSISNVSTEGNHGPHINGVASLNSGGNGYASDYTLRGASSHSGSASVTDNIYRYYMALYASASSEIAASEGMFGLWESATPPDGWAICDGTNGTPDLSSRFIGFNSSSKGSTAGTGNITTSGSLSNNGSHEHANGWASRGTIATSYHANSVTHGHSVGGLIEAFNPLYYTIIFIKCTG